MVAISFQRRFVPPIVTGRKPHTLRSWRRRMPRPGEALQLYTAMRTKACRKIGDATCALVIPCGLVLRGDHAVLICRRTVTCVAGLDRFAQMDGFRDWPDLRAFWHEHHPGVDRFEGSMIRWRGFVAEPGWEELEYLCSAAEASEP